MTEQAEVGRQIAGHDLTLGTSTGSREESHLHAEKKSGLLGTGGIGFTIGSQSQKTTDDGNGVTEAGSTVGSSQGQLILNAGHNLSATAADLVSGKTMVLSGENVSVLAGNNHSEQTHKEEQHQGGLTVALSGVVGSALNTAVQTANQAQDSQNGRLAALQGTKAALYGVQAYQGAQLADAQNEPGRLIGINASLGSQSSKSVQHSEQNDSQGSSLSAGGPVVIEARGADGDVTLQGTTVKSAGVVSLSAGRDINLDSALNNSLLTGSNQSHGGSVGVGVNFGEGAKGLSVSASANKGTGHEKGNGTTHSETVIDAGQGVVLNSGRDANLTGAQVSGESITGNIGRNLILTSEQDTNNYNSKQQNASAGGTISFGGGSGSINLSQDKLNSQFASVNEQTGLFAGNGGYHITVGNHTQLNGAVISSTATPDKNILDTATLGFGDIQNRAEYSAQHQSVGVSSGANAGSQFLKNGINSVSSVLAGINDQGSASGTTRSAISPGTITLRDPQHQTQDISTLSRDTANASGSISPIFDKQKEQQRLAQVQLVTDIGDQVGNIAATQGDIEASRAAHTAHPDLSGEALKATPEYQTVMKDYGTGSAVQQGVQAATAAATGLAGGDIGKALAGASAPYLAQVIKQQTTDEHGNVNIEANTIAHAILGGAVAAVNGNSALAGAASAGTAELAGRAIASELYGADTPGKIAALTEEQRQKISVLSTAAAGLAGGVTGDSSANAVAGAQAGKNAVENNLMGPDTRDDQDKLENKILEGDRSKETAQQWILGEYGNARSDYLINKNHENPAQMTAAEKAEMWGYINVYEAEMASHGDTDIGSSVTKMLLGIGPDYIKTNPNPEVAKIVDNMIPTWRDQKFNASFGQPVIEYFALGGPLGNAAKTGAVVAGVAGLSANVAVQLQGGEPFSYVDAVAATISSIASDGRTIKESMVINSSAAAASSVIQGKSPLETTTAVTGTALGTFVGEKVGDKVTDNLKPILSNKVATAAGNGVNALSLEEVNRVVQKVTSVIQNNPDEKGEDKK